MGKADKLKQRAGDNLAESTAIGGVATTPPPALKAGPAHDQGVEFMDDAVIVPIAMVHADPQIREEFSDESIAEIADSIRRYGQQFPITARWDEERARYIIIDGERRFRAIRDKLKNETIKVIRRLEKQSDIDILTSQIISNDQREDLQPLEKARAYRRFMQMADMSAHMAAKALGKAPSTFAAALAVLDTAPAVQAKVESGELSVSNALDLRKLNNPALQEEVAEQIIDGGLNREEAAEAVEEAKARDTEAAPAEKGKRGAKRGAKAAKSAGKSKKLQVWAPKLASGIKVTVEAKKGLDRDGIIEAIDQLRAKLDTDFPSEQAG